MARRGRRCRRAPRAVSVARGGSPPTPPRASRRDPCERSFRAQRRRRTSRTHHHDASSHARAGERRPARGRRPRVDGPRRGWGRPARMRTGRLEPVTTPNLRPGFPDWLAGARLRTLPAALAPVLAGTGAAGAEAKLGRALLAAAVALALQIGVHFANDYSDGVRGTDEHRVGPTRLTASGIVAPATVKRIAFAWFGAAAVAGLVLVWLAQAWWLIAAGVLAIVAAWFYTGGKKPY